MLVDETWVDLRDLMETYPHATLRLPPIIRDGIARGSLNIDGSRIQWRCLSDGEPGSAAYSECLKTRKARCGPNYVEEALPGIAACIGDGGGTGYNADVVLPLELLEALAERRPIQAALKGFPWVGDGTNSDELHVLYELHTLTSAVKLPEWELAMPFLFHIDALDIIVLETLRGIAYNHGVQIMSHPSLRNGVTDEKRTVIASLWLPEMNLSDWIDIILDAERTAPEERVIELPLAGKVALSVIRPGVVASEGARWQAMEFLEHAVRTQEQFMGVAFPQNHAIALIADVNEYGGQGSSRAIMSSDYEHQGVIAHETAHTYWHSAPTWVSEGGATFLGAISERDSYGAPLPGEGSCALADSLVELEVVDREIAEKAVYESQCNYTLGYGIFFELHQRLGEADFRRGFRNLYLARRDETHEPVCVGEYRSGCYLREAFADGATPEEIAVIDEIVARRYYGRATAE